MTQRLLFFGRLADLAGGRERTLAPGADDATVVTIIDDIARDEPALADALKAPDIRIAIDQAFADMNAPIAGASEIAFMPPFSGG